MEKTTIWLQDVKHDPCPSLENNIDVDVLIIGGGMTGISTAYHLRNSKLKIAVVDQDKIGHGVTSKSTAKLTFLQELIYSKLEKKFQPELVKLYLDSQIFSIKMVEDIIKKNHINCDFGKVDSYTFTNDEKEIDKIKKEKSILESMGIEVREYQHLPNEVPCKYTIAVSNTAVFHPIKYLMELKNICLKNKISVYERTRIFDIKKKKGLYYCIANKHVITCKKVVLACHYPFFLYPFFFPLKGHLERSYISASLIDKPKSFSAINTSVVSKSLRYHCDKNNAYFIYLSGSHTLEKKYNEKNNFDKLIKDAESLKLKPQYIWSNHDIITNDYLPYIGCLKAGDNTFLMGTGYNTWGMTNGSLAGKILSDIILEQENKYIPLFDPHRRKSISSLASIPFNVYCSVKPFIENKILKRKSWYSSRVYFKNKNGIPLAIYKDEKGKKHIVHNKCPHMKCSLVFNEVEKTWDCPCHGSRYSIDGECIQGPSNYDISYKP